MKVAVIDYGMGNLASVCRALSELGGKPFVADDPAELDLADHIVLPGVGNFSEGMAQLLAHGWGDAIQRHVKEEGKPLLGICLGMQLLADRGTEGGETAGLGLLDAEIVRLDALGCQLRLPHVGWNSLSLATKQASALLDGIPDGCDFYFVHSFGWRALRSEQVLALVDYGIRVPAVVGAGHVYGTQFHPEKSSRAGFRILKNFLQMRRC